MLRTCLCKYFTTFAKLASQKAVVWVFVDFVLGSARGPGRCPCGTGVVFPLPWLDRSPFGLVQIMGEALKDPVIKRCCQAPNRLPDLQHISEGLEKCQKGLNDYLDSKRNAFPRFFFISDDELLSILGSSDPLCVQEHMIKVGPQVS